MTSADDKARAARARERGREEREEKEREVDREANRERYRLKEQEERMAAACSPLAFLLADGVVVTGYVVPGLAFATFATMIVTGDHASDRSLGLLGAGISVVVGLAFFLVHQLVRSRVAAAWAAEKQWRAKLPFAIDKAGEGLASTYGHDLKVFVTFKKKRDMPADVARELLAHVDPGGKVTRHDERLEVCARLAGNPDGDTAQVRARRLLFHDLVDGVLLPLGADHPIDRIELDD